MANEILYMKLERNVEITQKDVFLKDIGKFVCKDEHMLAKIKAVKIYSFKKEKDTRQIISVLKVIELIQTTAANLTVENIGETDVVLELISDKKASKKKTISKMMLVSLVCFFGTFFTIMAFHNDIGISQMFVKMYSMITGTTSKGYTILEFSYSIGLAVGIIVFFNHIGPRRITKDPTPVEVEMRLYENDVNTSLVETANREGKTIDVS